MAKVNLEIKGADKLIKKLSKFGDKVIEEVDQETFAAAKEIELEATARAPKDTGRLAQSITTQKIADAAYRVFTNVRYAPYMEFGTGRLTSVPNELKDLAILFKGKGIREVNLLPQPFMWPAFIKERPKYIERLETMLKKLSDAV